MTELLNEYKPVSMLDVGRSITRRFGEVSVKTLYGAVWLKSSTMRVLSGCTPVRTDLIVSACAWADWIMVNADIRHSILIVLIKRILILC